jgi:hypothetical protein
VGLDLVEEVRARNEFGSEDGMDQHTRSFEIGGGDENDGEVARGFHAGDSGERLDGAGKEISHHCS